MGVGSWYWFGGLCYAKKAEGEEQRGEGRGGEWVGQRVRRRGD